MVDPRLEKPACEGLGPPKLLLDTPYFNVCDRGGYITTEYKNRPLVVLPVVEGSGIVMVRAKRPVLGDAPLELPAGGLNEGEDPAHGAARELAEETGIKVDDLSRFRMLPPMAGAPNRNPLLFYNYLVPLTHNEFSNRGAHDHEIESVHLFGFDEIRRKIGNGEIYVVTPIAVVLRYLDSLGHPPEK